MEYRIPYKTRSCTSSWDVPRPLLAATPITETAITLETYLEQAAAILCKQGCFVERRREKNLGLMIRPLNPT